MNPIQDAPAQVILPPRPNPGPESWPVSYLPAWWTGGLLVVLALMTFLGWWRLRKLRARTPPGNPPANDEPAPTSPADRLIRRAEAVRSALAVRFGPPWSAKTTEEVEACLLVDGRFGAPGREAIRILLREADRAKFAGAVEMTAEAQGDDGEAWASAALGAIAAAGEATNKSGR